MLQPHTHSKYRSVKYSTSSGNLRKMATENCDELHCKSRLSLCKENLRADCMGERPKTPCNAKGAALQNRWGNTKNASSHYKLRIVANSSHLRTRGCEKEEEERAEEGLDFVLHCNQSPPFNPYYSLLEEQLLPFPALLQAEREQTDSIRFQLQQLKARVSVQLQQQQHRFQQWASKLRLQMSLSFKNHSRQTINTRESLQSLHLSFHSLQQSLAHTDAHLSRLDDNFNS